MTRFVLRNGELVERHLAPPPPNAGRIVGKAPYIRTDGMDPVRSMASGRMFDSRSAYYADVRAAGCEIVGDDATGFGSPPGYETGDIVRDIKQATAELMEKAQ